MGLNLYTVVPVKLTGGTSSQEDTLDKDHEERQLRSEI